MWWYSHCVAVLPVLPDIVHNLDRHNIKEDCVEETRTAHHKPVTTWKRTKLPTFATGVHTNDS